MTDRLKMIDKLKLNDKEFYALSDEEQTLLNDCRISVIVKVDSEAGWAFQITTCRGIEIYRIHRDYTEPKVKVGKWEDFDVVLDKTFFYDNRWWSMSDIYNLMMKNREVKSFGGVQYMATVNGKVVKSAYGGSPLVGYDRGFMSEIKDHVNGTDGVLPVYPCSVLFYIEE